MGNESDKESRRKINSYRDTVENDIATPNMKHLPRAHAELENYIQGRLLSADRNLSPAIRNAVVADLEKFPGSEKMKSAFAKRITAEMHESFKRRGHRHGCKENKREGWISCVSGCSLYFTAADSLRQVKRRVEGLQHYEKALADDDPKVMKMIMG